MNRLDQPDNSGHSAGAVPVTGDASASPEQRGLLGALHAEYAAIFAYGLVAAYSRADRQEMIAIAAAAHRARRNQLVDALTKAGIPVPPADPGYTTPFPVTDPIPAAKLAAAVENDAAIAWRAALEQSTTGPTRQSCIDALTDCAVRLATWRAILGVTPSAVPLPGTP